MYIAFQSILVHKRSIFGFIESTLRKIGSTLGYLGYVGITLRCFGKY